MNNIIKSICLTLLLSTISLTSYAKEGFYIGGNIPFGHDNYIAPLGIKIDATNRLNVDMIAGYEFFLAESFGLGIEAQYSSLGEYKYSDVSTSKADAFLLNVKPKYYIADSQFYIGGVFGVGDVALDIKNHHFDIRVKRDAIGYQFGLEAGYQWENVDLAFGFKEVRSTIGSVDVRSSGPFVGARYKF